MHEAWRRSPCPSDKLASWRRPGLSPGSLRPPPAGLSRMVEFVGAVATRREAHRTLAQGGQPAMMRAMPKKRRRRPHRNQPIKTMSIRSGAIFLECSNPDQALSRPLNHRLHPYPGRGRPIILPASDEGFRCDRGPGSSDTIARTRRAAPSRRVETTLPRRD